MAQKRPTGPFWAHFGRFGAFSGHLGLLDAILDQYAAAGTSHAHNCASHCRNFGFPGQFSCKAQLCAWLVPTAAYWSKMTHKCPKLPEKAPKRPKWAPNCPVGPFLGHFGPILGTFLAFSDSFEAPRSHLRPIYGLYSHPK